MPKTIDNVKTVTRENLKARAWRAGYDGVNGLAKHIGRHPVTVHKAIRWPDQFGPTYRAILEALDA